MKNNKCKGFIQWEFGLEHDHDCGYNTSIACDDCKYGGGNKNPEVKCNKIKT